MAAILKNKNDIPIADFYVIAKDKFLSGWGDAQDKDNYVCLPCVDMEQATIVVQNCYNRSDMADICITGYNGVVSYVKSDDIVVSLMTFEDAPKWYKAGAFKDGHGLRNS